MQRLGNDLQRVRQDIDEARRQRHAIAERFEQVEGRLPNSKQAWDAERAMLTETFDTYEERLRDANAKFRQLVGERHDRQRDRDILRRDYQRKLAQKTRISDDMDDARTLIMRATGLDASELPYVAELMDVNERSEQWRLAMNVAYAPIAQTILVDKRHEQGFAAKISAIDPNLMTRRTWRFVDTGMRYDSSSSEGWMSSKLQYREDSPFVGWLKTQTTSPHFDARCVHTIDDSNRSERQVQADGQIKSGARGQHGTKDRAQVIGFVNETYLNALAAQVDAARNALSQADTDYTAAKTQSDNLHRELELANQLAYTSWERIDIAGAQRTITDTQDAIASIKNDPKLAELAKQRDELNAELDRVERQRIESDQAAARAGSAVEAALIWLRDHADTGTTDAAGATADNDDDAASGPLPDEVTAALAESYDNRFAGLADAAMRAHMIIGAGAAGTQAPGESFPERTIAGIGKDMASRINLLNGQADAARTGVESKMSTYIALYAADDDSLTASVEDYRYYLDELASLTQLAAVAATDAEYRRCLEQLLRSFLTIKRAIDTDASDIHDQLDRINAMLKGQQFGPKHGSLSLHADVRRPERTFWAQLIRVIGTLNDWKSADVNDSDASRKAFAACAPMVGLLRAELAQVKDANGVKSYGARNLDPRCRSSFYAIVHHADGPDERITSTGGRSGGALQELTSFVYGAALIYLLGGGLTSEPSYTTLFLDEALIKADGRYTQRALTVLPRLGFQVIVSAPESKTGEILEVSTKAYVTYKDPDTGLTSLREAVLHQNDMDDESSSDILKDDGVAE